MANNYFSRRLDHLGCRKKQIDSQQVQYTRRGKSAFWVDASVGKTIVAEAQSDGMVVEYQSRDYIFDSAELLDPETGIQFEPELGDRINDCTLVCEVMAQNEQTFRYTTQDRKRIRIHTKVVSRVLHC